MKSRVSVGETRSAGVIDDITRFIINMMLFGKLDHTVTKDVLAKAFQNPRPYKACFDSQGTAILVREGKPNMRQITATTTSNTSRLALKPSI